MSKATVPHLTASAPVKSLTVRVVKGPDAGRAHEASGHQLTIGTATDNDLILGDETVSRYHLQLQHLGDRILAQDLGSTNGTVSGSIAIERATITPGTVLSLGKTQIRIDDGAVVELELAAEEQLGNVRGRSPAMRNLLARVEKIARSDASVLLGGETGVGKEVVARAIHDLSQRATGPFETVDCGALSPTLVASELFGHEKGSFTGADRERDGAFQRAAGGTLFLDEIGELPPSLQTALLGALERRVIRRVGGDKAIPVDVRVVCATHRDLRAEVNSESFRQDLYYRIAVVVLRIPPLRERVEDIPLLVEHFLREAGHSGAVEELFPPAAMAGLVRHRWPGNVRELRNFVDAALAIGEAPTLDGEPGPAPSYSPSEGMFTTGALSQLLPSSYKAARAQVLDNFDRLYLRALLDRCQYNLS